MTGVAWYINDMKRKHEHAVRVQVRDSPKIRLRSWIYVIALWWSVHYVFSEGAFERGALFALLRAQTPQSRFFHHFYLTFFAFLKKAAF